MSDSVSALDADAWAHARGDKWARHADRMEATLAPVDPPLIDAAEIRDACRIADVGCGAGATSRSLWRRAPAGSVVHGFDLAPASIAQARARANDDAAGPTFEVADVATWVPTAPYDRLVSRFGTMFFSDPPAAFANLRRWLAPSGRFAFAVWASPRENPWMAVVRATVDASVALPATALDAPGPFRYGDVTVLEALLRDAGFEDVRSHVWRGSLALGGGLDAAAAATFALDAFSDFAERLDAAGPDVRRTVASALTSRFGASLVEGRVVLPAAVHLVTGRRA